MADLDSKGSLGVDDVDLVPNIHRSQVVANESHLRHPYAEHTRRETESVLNEETPKVEQAKKEDMRIDESLGAAAMALATLSSGAGVIRAIRDGQLVPALKPENGGDAKLTLLPRAASTVEDQSQSFKLAPGERIRSLSHLLEDRLSLAVAYSTEPPAESDHPRNKHASQPSMQKSFTPGAPAGQETRSASNVKDKRRDHPVPDRGLILKAQIPKKGRPISRHTPSSSQSNSLSTSIASLSGAPQPNYTCASRSSAGSWTSSFGTHVHQPSLQSPPHGHIVRGVAGQQAPPQSERVTSRPDRAHMSTSVAPHMNPQLYCGQQPGSFSTLTQTHVRDSAEGSGYPSGPPFQFIDAETLPKPTATFTASQFPKERYSLPQARSSDHHQDTNVTLLRHDRSEEVSPFPAKKYQEVENASAAGLPISMNSRKRNSAGIEKRQSISDLTFENESGIRPLPSPGYDSERRSDGDGLDPYELRAENRRASKRMSRSDLDFTGTGERPSLNKAGSHQCQPRYMVPPHGYNDPTLQARGDLEPETRLHSHSRSLDMTYAVSSRMIHRPRSMNHPVQPTPSGVDSYQPQRPPLPSFSSATAHPGRPNPSVSLVPRVTAAVPSMPPDCISSSVRSLPAVPAVTGDSMRKCTDHHPHASPSSHSLSSSSYYPSPTVSNSPRFEPPTDPTLVKKTSATFLSSTMAMDVLSSSNCSPVSALSQAGGEQVAPVVQGHHLQGHVFLDHKDPTEMTLRADRLAREMSGWSFSTLRGRRRTSLGAMRTTGRSTVRKTHGTYLKKHQILQQQLQQLQREQEMSLYRGARQHRSHQYHHDHYHHRGQQPQPQPQHQHQHQQQQQPRGQKEQAQGYSRENPSGLREDKECYTSGQLQVQQQQQQQPRPGRPPKERVLMRSQSSSAMVLEHSSSASFQSGHQSQPPEFQPSRMHHASESHQPEQRLNQSQDHRQQQQQQQQKQQQPRLLLRPVSLPLLARGSTDPKSPLFLRQPPLSQPCFQSMHVLHFSESKEPPSSNLRANSSAYRSSLGNRFHPQPTVVVPGKDDDEAIEQLLIRTPVSAP